MEPSPELQAVVGRFFAVMNARDAPTALNLHAHEPGVLFIGTDPDEWWCEIGAYRPVLEAQMREFEAASVTIAGVTPQNARP